MRAANILLVIVVALVLVPILAVFAGWLQLDVELWSHLISTRLPQLLINTFLLLTWGACMTFLAGVGLNGP